MPWIFHDSSGNRKESSVTTLARSMGQLASTTTFSHSTSGGWIQITGANSGLATQFDTASITDSTNGKLTAPEAGRYRVTATYHSNGAASGVIGIQINKNTTVSNTNNIAEESKALATGITIDLTASDVVSLAAGDYVALLVYQSSGGALSQTPGRATTFTLERVDEVTQNVVIVPSGAQTLICSSVLGAAQGIFDTNTLLGGNIPQAYNHLKMIIVARSNIVANNDSMYIRLNNDAGANYDIESFYGQGGTYSTSFLANAQTQGFIGWPPASSVQANAASLYECLVPLYTGTTFYKNITFSGGFNGATGASSLATAGINGWRNTGAVTRIQVAMGAFGVNSFLAGSAFYLYGIL